MSESSPLITQGRWAWRAVPVIALVALAVIWQSAGAIEEAEWEARRSLSRNVGGWSLIHAFTGRTVGR